MSSEITQLLLNGTTHTSHSPAIGKNAHNTSDHVLGLNKLETENENNGSFSDMNNSAGSFLSHSSNQFNASLIMRTLAAKYNPNINE